MTMKQFSKKGEIEKKKLEEANRDILPYDKLTDINYYEIESNSWFNINKAKLKNFKIDIINNSKANNNLLKCKKLILTPTIDQQNILKLWIEGYRKMYNETLKLNKCVEIMKKEYVIGNLLELIK
jgi:hypothetical protein